MKKIFITIAAIGSINCFSQIKQPLAITKKVAQYIIQNTSFQYNLDVFKPSHQLSDLQVINFDKNFTNTVNTGAIAYSIITAKKDTTILLELSHSGALQIIVNKKIIYNNEEASILKYQFLERNIKLEKQVAITLHTGENSLVLKSVNNNISNWKVLFQCCNSNIKIGLESLNILSATIKTVTNFLLIGGFQITNIHSFYTEPLTIESKNYFTKVYQYKNKNYTWTLPKIELTQTMNNPQPYWGSYFNYNYHAAGVAWAIAQLAKATGDTVYSNYSNNYCNFILQSKPFINYQVSELWQVNSVDHLMINTPLLDFTSATAMPFLYRLIDEPVFKERNSYINFINHVKQYIFKEQVRLPDGNFTRETPEKFTTWVDDMFMGLPFVIHCAEESKDVIQKKQLQDDAAKQVLAFANILFDKSDSLFHHAKHTTKPEIEYPYWLRANGWGIWAITEVLNGLPVTHPLYNKVMRIYKAHINSLIKYQANNGMWHNIINIPSTKLETSGSAIITLAIARGINNGWLQKEAYIGYAKKGWDAICNEIEDDGEVNNIMVGSFTNEDYHYYDNQPFVKNDSHGMLCVLMCGLEMSKLKM